MNRSTYLVKMACAFLLILLTVVCQFASAALRIGYYGGTFDPVTMGHRQLAERAKKAANLDLMYIIPSITNSKKPNASPYPVRKDLAQLGFAGLDGVLVMDSEMEQAFLQDRSRGVIRLLLKRHPGAHILKVTGDDVISRNFTDHLNQEELFKNVGFIIGERSGPNLQLAEDHKQFDFGNREVIILPHSEDKGISSSQVRLFLSEGDPRARYFLYPAVYEAIKAQGLFQMKCEFQFKKAN